MKENIDLIRMTAEIISSYAANNTLAAKDMPALMESIHATLARLQQENGAGDKKQAALMPAVPIKRSIFANHLICLEDGQKFKSLKRHLRAKYDMSPEEYREKWGLPPDYPMVAKNYASKRSRLAKQTGLGQRERNGKKRPLRSKTRRDKPAR